MKMNKTIYALTVEDKSTGKVITLGKSASYLKIDNLFDCLLAFSKGNCLIAVYEISGDNAFLIKKALT